MLMLPPAVLVVFLVIQLASGANQANQHVKALVDSAVEASTTAVLDYTTAEFEYRIGASSLQDRIDKSQKKEIDFSADFNASTAYLEDLKEKFRLEQERIARRHLEYSNKLKERIPTEPPSKPAGPKIPVEIPKIPKSEPHKTLSNHLSQLVDQYSWILDEAYNHFQYFAAEFKQYLYGKDLSEFPFAVYWTFVAALLVPFAWFYQRRYHLAKMETSINKPLDFQLPESPRPEPLNNNEPDIDLSKTILLKKPNDESSAPEPSASALPSSIGGLRVNKRGLRTLRPSGPMLASMLADASAPSDDPLVSIPEVASSTESVRSPSAPILSEPTQEELEKEKKGTEALDGWLDEYRAEQVRSLENASKSREDSIPAPLSATSSSSSIPSLHSSTPAFPHNNAPSSSSSSAKQVVDDSPTLSVFLRASPELTPVSVKQPQVQPQQQQPEAVSDDELMDALMDEPKPHTLPKPRLVVPQFQSAGNIPKFQLEDHEPKKLQPTMRAESEPALRVSIPNPLLTPIPNPTVSPDALADSRSLRKHSMRARPFLEPEEPEPQPSPVPIANIPRSRSSSIDSESQAARAIRAERGMRGSSSPTPLVREAIYRKELVGSQGENDSASKPKRELELSDNFESDTLDAESQPGSDYGDSDVE